MDELVVGTYEGFLLGYSVYSEDVVSCILDEKHLVVTFSEIDLLIFRAKL